MTVATFIAGRGGGKTWALCAWQRQDPEHRVIVVASERLRDWTARMLDPDTNPTTQPGVVTISQMHRLRGRDVVLAIDELDDCERVCRTRDSFLNACWPHEIAAYTNTGHSDDTQAEFLKQLGVQ